MQGGGVHVEGVHKGGGGHRGCVCTRGGHKEGVTSARGGGDSGGGRCQHIGVSCRVCVCVCVPAGLRGVRAPP